MAFVKAIYKFVAGNSRRTPIGLLIAALAAGFMAHSDLRLAGGIVFLTVLILTLTASVFEKER